MRERTAEERMWIARAALMGAQFFYHPNETCPWACGTYHEGGMLRKSRAAVLYLTSIKVLTSGELADILDTLPVVTEAALPEDIIGGD